MVRSNRISRTIKNLSVEGARNLVVRVIPRSQNQAWNAIPFLPAKKIKWNMMLFKLKVFTQLFRCSAYSIDFLSSFDSLWSWDLWSLLWLRSQRQPFITNRKTILENLITPRPLVSAVTQVTKQQSFTNRSLDQIFGNAKTTGLCGDSGHEKYTFYIHIRLFLLLETKL